MTPNTLCKLILLSKVYQLPAVKAPTKRKETPLLIGPDGAAADE